MDNKISSLINIHFVILPHNTKCNYKMSPLSSNKNSAGAFSKQKTKSNLKIISTRTFCSK